MKDEKTDAITENKRKNHLEHLREQIKNNNLTIISQNCIGGVIYNMLGMEFLSPTINLYINDEDFVKLVEKPKYYFSLEPVPFIENYSLPTDKNVHFPLIKVGDLTIFCRHYETCEDAINAWNRRKERINYDNIYVIATSWNLSEREDLIKKINDCKYPNVIFTYKKYDYPNCVYLKGKKWKKDERGFVKPALPNYSENGFIRNFEEQFDFVEWINTGIVKEKEFNMELAKNELRISITAACNMKCVYCHNEGNKKFAEMTPEQIRRIIESAKGYNLKKIRITGGEPMVSPHVEEICRLLTEDYNLSVEMNTNGIEIEKILRLIDNGWLKKVVVGMDYFDAKISKNSPVGKSSEEIKNNILEIKKHGCDVRIATVYNEDDLNTLNIIKWAIDNEIGVRVLEIVKDKTNEEYSKKYINFLQNVTDNVDIDWYVDERLQEINGSKNGKTLVKFYHSLCRLNLCDVCQKIPFRITSDGTAKPCLLSTTNDINLFDGDINKNFKKVLNYKLNNDNRL